MPMDAGEGRGAKSPNQKTRGKRVNAPQHLLLGPREYFIHIAFSD